MWRARGAAERQAVNTVCQARRGARWRRWLLLHVLTHPAWLAETPTGVGRGCDEARHDAAAASPGSRPGAPRHASPLGAHAPRGGPCANPGGAFCSRSAPLCTPQVHDDVMLEVEEAALPEIAALTRAVMVQAGVDFGLRAPLAVRLRYGPNWHDLADMD